MSNRQDKVLVALKPEPRICPADRWTAWARSMTDRHERIAARQGGLIMTLVEPLRMFTSINQRLEQFTLALFPRLQISIGPILSELMRAQSQSFSHSVSSLQTTLTFPKVTVLENTRAENTTAWNTRLQDTRVLQSHTAAVWERREHGSKFVLAASQQFHTDREQSSEQSFSSSQSPLRLLFARLHRDSQTVGLKKTLVENESKAIAERVVQEHLRVEQRRRGEMIIRKQTIPGASPEDRRSELEVQLATTKTRERSWAEKPPEVNVEQLTEQVIRRIDHRITAYRERLGRGF